MAVVRPDAAAAADDDNYDMVRLMVLIMLYSQVQYNSN